MYFEFYDSKNRITDLVNLEDIAHVDVSFISFDQYNIKCIYYSGISIQLVTTQKQQEKFIRSLVFFKNNMEIN